MSPLLKPILSFASICLLFTSCASIRTSNRIEQAFYKSYRKEVESGNTPKTFYVSNQVFESPTTISSDGSMHSGRTIRSIDVYFIDTATGAKILIDDFKNIEAFMTGNSNAEYYLKKYRRQKISRKVHRYTNYALIGGSIALLSTVKEDNVSSKKDDAKLATGGYMLLGGLLNWTGGSFIRALQRRSTMMKAAYMYHYGVRPKSWTSLR